MPGEAPESVPSGGEGLGDSAEDAADGLAGGGGEPCEVESNRMTSWKLFSLRFYWGDVGADAEHGPTDGVGGVMAQVKERDQNLLVGEQLAPAAAADGPPAVLFGGLLGLSPLQKRRQDGGEQDGERSGFEAKESAKAIFGEAS